MAEKEGKSLGAKVRKARERAGLSQTELGEKLGVSYQQIQKYERGISRMSVETLLRLSKALDQPFSAFLPPGAAWDTGQLSEPKPDYAPISKEERDLLKAFREAGDDKIRAAFLATLKAAASRKH